VSTRAYETRLRENYTELLREASQFYMSQGDVYTTLRNLTHRLDQEKMPYALVGGMAMAAHGFVRMTQDVVILMTAEGRMCKTLSPRLNCRRILPTASTRRCVRLFAGCGVLLTREVRLVRGDRRHT
jgi:hypothetical protein